MNLFSDLFKPRSFALRGSFFIAWYVKLLAGNPRIGKEQITLTTENFKKALKQAYNAGWNDRVP